MLLGLLCAAVAALGYGSASVLQDIGVRRAGGTGSAGDGAGGSAGASGAGGLLALRHQPLYFLGLGMDGAGFVATVVALQFLPLFLVQAVVAASVAVTAAIAAALGRPLGRSGWVALAGAATGLVLLGVSAAGDHAQPLPLVARWLLLALVVPVILLGRVAAGPGVRSATLLALATGLGFTIVAVASRTLVFPHPWWHLFGDPALWAVLAGGATALTLFTLALQIGDVTVVSAITFTVETVLPSAVGLALLGDQVRPGFWPLAVLGFVLAVGGAVALSRYGGAPVADDSVPRGAVATDGPSAGVATKLGQPGTPQRPRADTQ